MKIMSKLSEDLEKWAGEFEDETDLKRRARIGLRIVGEVLGGASLFVAVALLLINGLPIIGIPVTGYILKVALTKVSEVYSNWDAEKRKNVRAVFTIVRRVIPL
jgi:hypothetical protein